jgi:hypothetical protein
MIELSRRRTLLGGLLVLLEIDAPCCAHAGEFSSGCYVPPKAAPVLFARAGMARMYETGHEDIEPNSGDRQLDRALAQSLAKLSRTWDVLPGFSYFREPNEPNALATSEALLHRSDGTVLFGKRLLRELMQLSVHRDAAIVAVCAHEFGHVVQFKRRLRDKLAPDPDQPFRSEQHADYLAGFYGGLRKREHADFPAVVFATTQRRYGTLTRSSHGTGEQRGQAVLEGFKAAYERRLSPDDAVMEGFNFAMSRT